MSTPVKDFDSITGKLVPVGPTPAKEPVLANPAKLAPSGSPPARANSADWIRSILTGVGAYGALQIAVQLLDYFGANTAFLGPHGVEWGAFLVAGSHLIQAYMRDNTPRVP